MIYGKRHGVEIKREMVRPFFGMGNDDIFPGLFQRDFTPEEIAVMAEEKELFTSRDAVNDLYIEY